MSGLPAVPPSPAARDAWTRPLRQEDHTVRWVPDDVMARERFADAYVTDGIVRWHSNDRVPPADCRAQWARLGLPFDADASERVYQTELAESIAAYRAAWRPPSGELLSELQAEFGPGTVVVDVISGMQVSPPVSPRR